MGFSNSWLAVKATSKTVLDYLGLYQTTEICKGFPVDGADISMASLPNGWLLLFFGAYEHPLTEESAARKMSSCGDVLICKIEEHVMASDARLYQDGALVWALEHVAERGVFDMVVSGSPPEGFYQLWHETKQEQIDEGGEEADVDMLFDLPIKIAEKICQFRHDYFKFKWGSPVFYKLLPLTHA